MTKIFHVRAGESSWQEAKVHASANALFLAAADQRSQTLEIIHAHGKEDFIHHAIPKNVVDVGQGENRIVRPQTCQGRRRFRSRGSRGNKPDQAHPQRFVVSITAASSRAAAGPLPTIKQWW